MKVGELEVGDTAEVTGFESGSREYRHKLMRMGLVRGCRFRLVRRAPLGDPVEIELGSHRLTLRRVEADVLRVERDGG